MSEREHGALGIEAPEASAAESGSLWSKLKRGLRKTHDTLLERVGATFDGRAEIDEEALERLEEALIGADLGVQAATEVVEAVRGRARGWEARDIVSLRQMLIDEIAILLLDAPPPPAETRASGRGRSP